MCGRYAFILPKEAMRDLFTTLNEIDYPPRYNIAPTQPIIVIVRNAQGNQAVHYRWGYVPGWVKDPRDFPLIINARVETINEKPAFRGALAHFRCIVPASGYYEWQKQPDGSKIPYYIQSADGNAMGFAGIWSTWQGPDGEEVDTTAIITVPAGAGMEGLHARMPAILDREEFAPWLDLGAVDAKEAQAMLKSRDSGLFELRQVSTQVNAVRNDGPDLISPDAAPASKRVGGQGQLF